MVNDVFISFSTEDIDKANEIREILESHGIRCWFAPRSLHGIDDFKKNIPKAIRESKTFLLLLSEKSQESDWVQRELSFANEVKVPVLAYFLENCELKDNFRFVLALVQRYEIKNNGEDRLVRLRRELKEIFDIGDYDINSDENYVKTDAVEDEIKNNIKKSKKKDGFNRKKAIISAVAGIILVAIIAVALFFVFGNNKDGEYVIWSPEYQIALSGEVAKNNHYHAGEAVAVKNGNPSGYSKKCVWTLDFNDDGTFTISRNNMQLGIEPGYNGIGIGDEYFAKLWELVEADDGLYYIKNVDTDYWLEWYPEKNNWTTHYEIKNDDANQFLIALDKVG